MNTDALNTAIETCQRHGLRVISPVADDWIAPIDLWLEMEADTQRYCPGTRAQFYDRLHHPRCPHVQRKVGPSGRLLALRPTADLLAFLRRPAQPGKRL